MPPRYSYWTIIADGLPTAFRAADRDELLPTFARIKHKHPDAELKWFARGRLWDSPESARPASRPPSGPSDRSRPATPRGRDWRPGGEHRDPRQKYRDAKKARNVEERKRKFDRRQRFESKSGPAFARPKPDRPRGPRVARDPRGLQKKFFPRNQGTDEPAQPPRPAGPSREPRPREGHEPTPPPRPTEPVITPPGPPERGRRDVRRDSRGDARKRRPRKP
jgi:hypothetical protein